MQKAYHIPYIRISPNKICDEKTFPSHNFILRNKKEFWRVAALYFYLTVCGLPILSGSCVLTSGKYAGGQHTSPPSLRQSAGNHIKIQCCQPRIYLLRLLFLGDLFIYQLIQSIHMFSFFVICHCMCDFL